MLREKSLAQLKVHANQFKQAHKPADCTVTLAGTGPNGAGHIAALQLLGLPYLRQIKTLNVISGSCFSFMACMAYQMGHLQDQIFTDYDRHVRKLHVASLSQTLLYLIRKKRAPSGRFPNNKIGETIRMLFGDTFANLPLKDVPYPICFYAYCRKQKTVIALDKYSYPEMTMAEVAQATATVPLMHGTFEYNGHDFMDPIFCPEFKTFRRKLLSSKGPNLYINHKKTEQRGQVYFLRAEERHMPELAMLLDFLFFYFGLPNRYVKKLHHSIYNQGFYNGNEA